MLPRLRNPSTGSRHEQLPAQPAAAALLLLLIASCTAPSAFGAFQATAGLQAAPHTHTRRQLGFAQCVLREMTYHPSHLEQEWTTNVHLWASKDTTIQQYCRNLSPAIAEIRTWLPVLSKLMSSPLVKPVPVADLRLLSYFKYTYDCGGTAQVHRVPIEPLVGSLRHPLFPCDLPRPSYEQPQIVDQSYLLMASPLGAPYFGSSSGKVYFFDLGATTYTQGTHGATQQWFVETLASRGFEVDAYFGWEVVQYNDTHVLEQVPAWLLPRYHYFNIPAPTDPASPGNPLNMIKSVTKRDDYVLLKLDIDNSVVELEFIKQMLGDADVTDLVDEFFFEHHVNFQPMHAAWATEAEPQVLKDSYDIFGKLRHLGVRAHGWV